MLEKAAKAPVTYDEENPSLTDEQLRRMKRVGRPLWVRSLKKYCDADGNPAPPDWPDGAEEGEVYAAR